MCFNIFLYSHRNIAPNQFVLCMVPFARLTQNLTHTSMLLFILRKKALVVDYIHMTAIMTTKVLAEALTNSSLVVIRSAVAPGKIYREEGGECFVCEAKVDCEFFDTSGKKHIAIAMINLFQKDGDMWKPRFHGHFITLDSDAPRWMGFKRTSPHSAQDIATVWPTIRRTDPIPDHHDYSRLLSVR